MDGCARFGFGSWNGFLIVLLFAAIIAVNITPTPYNRGIGITQPFRTGVTTGIVRKVSVFDMQTKR